MPQSVADKNKAIIARVSLAEKIKAIGLRAAAGQCNALFLDPSDPPPDRERLRARVAAANKAVDDFFAPDFTIHNTFPGLGRDAKGTKQWNAEVLEALPDYNVTIDGQIAEHDKVVTRWTARGTHKGKFQGIAPTGRKVTISGTTINRYVDGKIAESWVELDTLDLMRQLGAER